MKTLITGGTGTLGKALAKQLNNPIIFSRNEHNQVEMQRDFPDCKFIIGDVRDYKALREATKGVGIIYHLAAIKHVTICEQQPFEAIKTNVYGTANVIRAAKKNGCHVHMVSTDKAENPTSFYGTTKLMAEILLKNNGFTFTRSGNIFGSSGSVIPFFIKQIKDQNKITLTDGEMTRFWILADDLAEDLVNAREPEFFVTTMNQIAIACMDLYGDSKTEITVVGPRPGERKHELLNGLSSETEPKITNMELYKIFERWHSSLT